MSFSEKVIDFNKNLKFSDKLPKGYLVLNPFIENIETLEIMQNFYKKFYNDNIKRKFIIGINPSRHGAGVTGVPFTDTKRLFSECGIKMNSAHTHELSSVFMYDMIAKYGGVHKFYSNFYINSPFPLAIVREKEKGKFLNANYYDDKTLFSMLKSYMIYTMNMHFSFGLENSEVIILGKKNAEFLKLINKEAKLFDKFTILEHPRYIMQYKSKNKNEYIDKYLNVLL